MGNGKTKQEVIQGVKRLVEKKRGNRILSSIERDGGSDLQRHPELSLRSTNRLSYCRSSSISQSSLDYLLKDSIEDGGLMEMPSCIYTMDETGMPLKLKQTTPRGIKKVHGSSSGNKMQITILACASAVGTMLPPDHELFVEWLV